MFLHVEDVFYIVQLNWNGLRVPKCSIILKKFLLTLLLRNGKREFKIICFNRSNDGAIYTGDRRIHFGICRSSSKDYMIKFEGLSSPCTHLSEIMQRSGNARSIHESSPGYRTGYLSTTSRKCYLLVVSVTWNKRFGAENESLTLWLS
jgi:hypothetical protein